MSDIWGNFSEVTKHVPPHRRLYRSAAPNYNGSSDTEQEFTEEAVDVLVGRFITGIISFNEYPYAAAAAALLGERGIRILHLPVKDGNSPTMNQLCQAYEFVIGLGMDTSSLVHCGYGDGRTGTGITAIQLHATLGAHPLENLWKTVNRVEHDAQVAILAQLRDWF